MFWRKQNRHSLTSKGKLPHSFRFCNVYISARYQEILFVPYGQAGNGLYVELDNLIIDKWPCRFQDLQTNIEEALKRFSPTATYIKGKWLGFERSQAKSQRSYETDYIRIRLETDLSRSYEDGEVERIKVTAHPTALDDTYSLVGCTHLLDTKVAQIVVDIYEACMKIKS